MVALAYREKSDNGKKAKAKKDNFLSYFLATYRVTTLPKIPEEKKKIIHMGQNLHQSLSTIARL